jgi:hypothetical protein
MPLSLLECAEIWGCHTEIDAETQADCGSANEKAGTPARLPFAVSA